MTLWARLGITTFWLTWPLIWVYVRITPPRTKILVVSGGSLLVVGGWLSHGKWLLPGGGIQSGEEPVAAAVRELIEETGITTEGSHLQPLGLQESNEAGGIRLRYHLFVLELSPRPTVRPAPREIMRYQWLDIHNVTHDKTVSMSVKRALAAWNKT